MKVTQTVELSADEKKAIQTTIGICDKISDLCHKASMLDVFEYFTENADLVGDYDYVVDNLVQLGDLD